MNGRDYLTLFRESRFLIACCVAACLVLACGATLVMPKSYESQVTYFVSASGPYWGNQLAASESLQGATLAENRVKSYMELVTGPTVAKRAAAALGDTTPDAIQSVVSTETVSGTVIFTVTVREHTAVRAVAVASAVSSVFAKLVDDIETPSVITEQVPAVTVDAIAGPTEPTAPATPRLDLNLLIGLILGLLLGIGVAIARRSLDRSVKTVDSLVRAADAPVLGIVPRDKAFSSAPVLPLGRSVGLRGTAAVRAEAYRRIRTVIESVDDGDEASQVLVVTSPNRGDGRSVTACNLAAAFAATGRSVVLVDADLRRPRVAHYLGFEGVVGLTDVLAQGLDVGEAVQPATVGSFDVLLSGQTATQPNEVLSSRRAGQLIDTLRARYDVVVIDSPPILPFADAANIGAFADGAVLVCPWGSTTTADLTAATAFLRSVSIPVIGSVLSSVPEKAMRSSGSPSGVPVGVEPDRRRRPSNDVAPAVPHPRPARDDEPATRTASPVGEKPASSAGQSADDRAANGHGGMDLASVRLKARPATTGGSDDVEKGP